METPDVPVNENAKQLNPLVHFGFAGVMSIALIPAFLWGSIGWQMKAMYVFLVLSQVFLGLNTWKGREIVQWFLNHFPAERRKSAYYLLNVFGWLLLISFLSFMAYWGAHLSWEARVKYHGNVSFYNFVDLMMLVVLAAGLFTSIQQIVKNYRLYKAALPQP